MSNDPVSAYLTRPLRTEAQARAEIVAQRLGAIDEADRLDDLLVAAKGLKLKLLAAHKYPADPATARQWRRENRSYLGGLDLSDEIGFADELIESLELQIRAQRDGR